MLKAERLTADSQENAMRQSYCGLCDDCQLGNPDFLQAVVQLKEYVNRFRANVWLHCFPDGEDFSFPEFKKGLDWFLDHTDCPGCQGGRGLEDCPVRLCAVARGLTHCYLCPDLAALRQVRLSAGPVPRRQDQPAAPPVERQGQAISSEAGNGKEIGAEKREKWEKMGSRWKS